MKKHVWALMSAGMRSYTFDTTSCELSFAPEGVRPENLIVPGFVDIHTHGAFGIDFMSADRTEMEDLCAKLANVGYEGLLPTTVTASADNVKRALEAIPNHPMILGFHLEGPFISPRHPGAQPQDAIVPPPAGPSEWDVVLDDPRLRIVTLAPEMPGAEALIRRLVQRGVKVSFGHTDATYDQCQAGHALGMTHVTHTYNAMRGLHHREPGTVGFALTEEQVYAELIYDRHHVSKPAAEVLYRCKAPDEMVAISDSTMAAGLPDGSELKMWGLDCRVGGGTVRLRDGTLAGSAITLLDAFRNLYQDLGPVVAIRACCLNPRRALGMDVERPRVYLEFDRDLELINRYERPSQ